MVSISCIQKLFKMRRGAPGLRVVSCRQICRLADRDLVTRYSCKTHNAMQASTGIHTLQEFNQSWRIHNR